MEERGRKAVKKRWKSGRRRPMDSNRRSWPAGRREEGAKGTWLGRAGGLARGDLRLRGD